jgi:hypothetical protein
MDADSLYNRRKIAKFVYVINELDYSINQEKRNNEIDKFIDRLDKLAG